MTSAEPGAAPTARQVLRQHLLSQRGHFMKGPDGHTATSALARSIVKVVSDLEPGRLGLYWRQRFEFDVALIVTADAAFERLPLALPFAERRPVQMHYREWNGRPPTVHDDCGIPCSEGSAVVPDVVLVPCVGYTRTGFRLGYGGGYFDRWLALHPTTTAIGIAWAGSEIEADAFEPQPHDLPLTLIVTDQGVT